jgi:DnaJ like chaperone protein
MAKFGKWIGAGLGWAFGGPIGAVIGLGLGYIFDTAQQSDTIRGYSSTTTGDFALSMLVLIAAVMKADKKIMRSELEYTKTFMVRKFGVASANEGLKMLQGLLKQDIPVADVCYQIRDRLEYHSRLELLHLLYGIALADGSLHAAELNLINQIASYINIAANDQQSIRSMFIKDNESAYKILGVDRNDSVAEIKKAYRKLAIEFHPDKVSYLGEEFRKDADEKFRKINEAYEKIKKEKGFK